MIDYTGILEKVSPILNDYKEPTKYLNRLFSSLRSLKTPECLAFWDAVSTRNIFVAALLLKKAEEYYLPDEPAVGTGRKCIRKKLATFVFSDAKDKCQTILPRWLSEITLQYDKHISSFTRVLISQNPLNTYLPYLQCSGTYADNILFLLFILSKANKDQDIYKKLRNDLCSVQRIDVSDAKNKAFLSKLIRRSIYKNEISVLIELNELFTGFIFFEEAGMTRDELKEYLLKNKCPNSMYLYIKCLEREKAAPDEILREIYVFTSWSTENAKDLVNNCIYFAYAVKSFPEDYERFAELMEGSEAGFVSDMTRNIPPLSSFAEKELISDTFFGLIAKMPKKAHDFIKKIRPINGFSRSNPYLTARSRVGFPKICSKNDVQKYISDRFSTKPADAIELYMNSPLKVVLSLSMLIRTLYNDELRADYLNSALNDTRMDGRLSIDERADMFHRFCIKPKYVFEQGGFYIERGWIKSNLGTLNSLKDGDTVSFQLICTDPGHDMSFCGIYAYNIMPISPISVGSENSAVRSKAFHFPSKIISNNSMCNVMLFSMAWIENDNNELLVDRSEVDGMLTDRLAFYPVYHYQSAKAALLDLLKGKFGFLASYDMFDKDDIPLIGIRNVVFDKNNKAVFYIYRVRLRNYSGFVFKPYHVWRDKADFLNSLDASDWYSFRFFSWLDPDSGCNESVTSHLSKQEQTDTLRNGNE